MKNFYKKPSSYTTLPNAFVQDNRLSIEARGLGLLIFSLPENWTFRQIWFYKNAGPSKNRKKTVVPALNELIKFGYLARTQVRGHGKFSESIWFFDPEGQAIQLLHTVVTSSDCGTVGTASADPIRDTPSSSPIKEIDKKEIDKKEENTPHTTQREGGVKSHKKNLNFSEIADLQKIGIATLEEYIKFRLNSGGIETPAAFEKSLLKNLCFQKSNESLILKNWLNAYQTQKIVIDYLRDEFLSIPSHWFSRYACRERGKDDFILKRSKIEPTDITIEIAYQLAEQVRRDLLSGDVA